MQVCFLRVWFLSRSFNYDVSVQISNRTKMCRRIVTQQMLVNLAQTLSSYHSRNRREIPMPDVSLDYALF